MAVEVFNLATGRYGPSFTLDARESVIAAHAQSLGDWNTWDYEKNYGDQVVEFETASGCPVVRCGDFTTGGHNNGRW